MLLAKIIICLPLWTTVTLILVNEIKQIINSK